MAASLVCSSCGTPNPANNRFCGNCGTPTGVAAPAFGTAGATPEREGGERRRVVLMFSDVASSTEIAGRLDPEEWRDLLAEYHHIVADAVAALGGFVAKYLGDGVIAYFGWPVAHENDGERAVLAGRTILDRIAAQNHGGAEGGQELLGVRIGLHAGEVVISRSGDVYGEAPNIAARVQSVAEIDSIVMTDTVFRSLAGRIVTEPLGEHTLRGIERPIRLHRLARRGSPIRQVLHAPPATRFVGRQRELGTLLELWDRARSGSGQFVVVTGEAGLGKSRLVGEFRARTSGQGHVWLAASCSDLFSSTPLYPIVRLLERLIGSTADVQPDETRRRLGRMLASAKVELADAADVIADLLASVRIGGGPLASQAIKRRNLQLRALLDWVIAGARRRPVVLILEDLHWADPSTLELLELLATRVQDAPLLVVATARSGFRVSWQKGAAPEQIVLERLGRDEIREIAQGATADALLAEDVVETIVNRASGVPLFAEELARLIEARPGISGRSEIPETIAASLNARLDRLGPAREVAQIAAVIGDDFSLPLLAAVAARPVGDLSPLLDRLVAADVLSVKETSAGNVMTFRHSLIRDSAYETLLRSRRRDLHERAADIILEAFQAMATAHPEIIARHYSAAARNDRAVPAWQTVATVAEARGAYREAEEAYQQALSNLLAQPHTRDRDLQQVRLQNDYVYVLHLTRGYSASRTAEAIEQAKQLVDRIGGVEQSMPQVASQWAAASSAGKYVAASQIADQFLALARHQGSEDSLANAHMIQMTSRHRRGDLVGAEEHFRQGQPLFAQASFMRRPGAAAQAFGNASLNAWTLGHADEARRRMAHAVKVAASNSPYDVTFSKSMAAVLAVLLRDDARADGLARQSLEMAESHQFPQFAAISRIALGRAQAGLGSTSEGIDHISRGLGAMTATGSRVAMTRYVAWLAEAHALKGDPTQAMQAIERALTINPEELFFQPELVRLRGEFWAMMDRFDHAEADFRTAITIASRMDAVCLHLRAAVSLHRLLVRRGGQGAASLVRSIRAVIREGHDTQDARDASEIVGAPA
ncbi:AAA family ATPase [Reyranella sp.]|uniref:AAA family ATPase n=1 Tax=Reyranella sp. TaxID=1929291 RepID=UPI003783B891